MSVFDKKVLDLLESIHSSAESMGVSSASSVQRVETFMSYSKTIGQITISVIDQLIYTLSLVGKQELKIDLDKFNKLRCMIGFMGSCTPGVAVSYSKERMKLSKELITQIDSDNKF